MQDLLDHVNNVSVNEDSALRPALAPRDRPHREHFTSDASRRSPRPVDYHATEAWAPEDDVGYRMVSGMSARIARDWAYAKETP